MTWWMHVIEVVVLFSVVMTLTTLTMWAERRLLGLLQERWGPNRVGPLGLLQPVADVIKLMTKEDWIPPFADKWVFLIAPLIVSSTTVIAFGVVPVGPGFGIADLDIGLLFFLGMGSLSVYSALLGGWASNNKYSLLGGLRAASQTISYEVFMGVSVLGVVAISGSFDLRHIVNAQTPLWFAITQPVGFVVFSIAGIAEMHRTPFDLPEAEPELVAGFHSEYSSMKFGLFFVGEYASMVVISAALTALFLGGWHGPFVSDTGIGPWIGVLWFTLKELACLFTLIWIRASLPRPRFDQLMGWGWKYLLPLCLLQLVVTGAVLLALHPAS